MRDVLGQGVHWHGDRKKKFQREEVVFKKKKGGVVSHQGGLSEGSHALGWGWSNSRLVLVHFCIESEKGRRFPMPNCTADTSSCGSTVVNTLFSVQAFACICIEQSTHPRSLLGPKIKPRLETTPLILATVDCMRYWWTFVCNCPHGEIFPKKFQVSFKKESQMW